MNRTSHKRKRKTKGVLFLRDIPIAVKSFFKGKCATRGDSMQDVMEALMRYYCDNPAAVDSYVRDVKNRKRGQGTFR